MRDKNRKKEKKLQNNKITKKKSKLEWMLYFKER
jgi:hypothetical protein